MDHPYLRLAPFKVEIVRQNPLAVLFYDIISDNETRIIQNLATPKLKPALIHNLLTGNSESATFRVAKRLIDRLLQLATNLEKKRQRTPYLGVHNYGIGGQYEPHLDSALIKSASEYTHHRQFGKQCFEKLGTGNRIVTILIYMNEPEIGGRTVFMSNLKISMPMALFWYNLMRSGEIDKRSRHAACPVLTGIKWSANKWFHERGQESSRPCGLNQFDQELYIMHSSSQLTKKAKKKL
ncbi:Prolyl 4-hydroxylase subunit [Dirofilaria immitis]